MDLRWRSNRLHSQMFVRVLQASRDVLILNAELLFVRKLGNMRQGFGAFVCLNEAQGPGQENPVDRETGPIFIGQARHPQRIASNYLKHKPRLGALLAARGQWRAEDRDRGEVNVS